MYPKYEDDFYGWAMANASLLKKGNFNEVDMENIIEEIEAMGRREKSELTNRLAVLIAHLLKWTFQPDFRGRSWHGTIKEQRKQSQILLEDNPSLKGKLTEILTNAYELAVSQIEKETPISLKVLPLACPYTLEQCLDNDFYPE